MKLTPGVRDISTGTINRNLPKTSRVIVELLFEPRNPQLILMSFVFFKEGMACVHIVLLNQDKSGKVSRTLLCGWGSFNFDLHLFDAGKPTLYCRKKDILSFLNTLTPLPARIPPIHFVTRDNTF